MNIRPLVQIWLRWLIVITACMALVACATAQGIVDHHFQFDAIADSPDVEVLDYRYGDSLIRKTRNPDYLSKEGKSLQATSISGDMRKGDYLYVKWRVKRTGQIFEDTVDLRQRLPDDIAEHHIYFIIQGPQLYVYLISPERRPPEIPVNGPRKYHYFKTTTIYPDQPKP